MAFLLHSTSFNTHYLHNVLVSPYPDYQACCRTCNRHTSLWQGGLVNVLMGSGIFFLYVTKYVTQLDRKSVTGIWYYRGIELHISHRGLLKYFRSNYMLMLFNVLHFFSVNMWSVVAPIEGITWSLWCKIRIQCHKAGD